MSKKLATYENLVPGDVVVAVTDIDSGSFHCSEGEELKVTDVYETACRAVSQEHGIAFFTGHHGLQKIKWLRREEPLDDKQALKPTKVSHTLQSLQMPAGKTAKKQNK